MTRDSLVHWAIVALLGVAGGLVGDSYIREIFILVFIWGIIIASWDLILGYAGILNYAQVVFFAVGAYGSAIYSRQGSTLSLGHAIAQGCGPAVRGQAAFKSKLVLLAYLPAAHLIMLAKSFL